MNGAEGQARVVRPAEQPIGTWRGGTTRAIYAEPASDLERLAAAYVWVGTATITRDGPYSVFVDRTRIHMPIRGNGLHLHFRDPEETQYLPSFAQATFAGDRPLAVTLADGPVEALNVIAHPSVKMTVHAVRVTEAKPFALQLQANQVYILYLVDGRMVIKEDRTVANLSPGEAMIYGQCNVRRTSSLVGGGTLILTSVLHDW